LIRISFRPRDPPATWHDVVRRSNQQSEHAAMKIRLWLVLACLLAIAGCSASATTSDQDKQNGLYGGVTGGWTHP
jgi:hypothetical protein